MVEDNIVMYNGEPKFRLSQRLIHQKGLTQDQVDQIKALHVSKLGWLEVMEQSNNREYLRTISKIITEIEFKLQKAWGFSEDINYHVFWALPHCKCPALDNNDNYPTGPYVINGDCPIHGE